MAAVATIQRRDVWGTRYANRVTVAFDASYPTGGEAITLAEVELTDVEYVIFPEQTAGYLFSWDDANSKIIVYWFDYDAAGDAKAVEVANATDLSTDLAALPAIFVGTK